MISTRVILKGFIKVFSLVAIALLLALLMRVFLFSAFKIPSDSMAPSLLSGDYIIALKLIPGPRICKNFDFLKMDGKPEFWRLRGLRAVERNDVLVFHFPYTDWNKLTMNMNTFYVKRCVALPGDLFYIENGRYKVKGYSGDLGNVAAQLKVAEQDSSCFSAEVFQCNPKAFGWNIHNFGPLYVPRKGDVVKMDSLNFSLYRKLIEYETDMKVTRRKNAVLLNDSLISTYTFTTNYYFMAGDNVRDSRDSRYWGLLPEDHILGKAVLIWKSVDPYSGEVRWKRVMRAVK